MMKRYPVNHPLLFSTYRRESGTLRRRFNETIRGTSARYGEEKEDWGAADLHPCTIAESTKANFTWPAVTANSVLGAEARFFRVIASTRATVSSRALLVAQASIEERLLAADDGFGDEILFLDLDIGQLEHDVGHDFFDDAAQAAGAGIALSRHLSDELKRLGSEVQLRALHFK